MPLYDRKIICAYPSRRSGHQYSFVPSYTSTPHPLNFDQFTHQQLGNYLRSVTRQTDWKRRHVDVYQREQRDVDEPPTDYLIDSYDILIELRYQVGINGHLRIFQF